MRILVACERSGIVRDAFIRQGHDAVSCDTEPTLSPGPHMQRDVRAVLGFPWDMIIAFPDCTHLAVSGALHFKAKRADGRQQAAIDFFMLFANHPCHRVSIENPIGIMSRMWRRPNQIIQPWHFGHDASKATCLWLKGLPNLEYNSCVLPRLINGKRRWANQTDSGQNRLGPSDDRPFLRAKTYSGIAEAMATQWSDL